MGSRIHTSCFLCALAVLAHTSGVALAGFENRLCEADAAPALTQNVDGVTPTTLPREVLDASCAFFLESSATVQTTSATPAPTVVATAKSNSKDAGSSLQPIPPPPSSLALGMAGLAGLGVVHAGRSVRKFQFGFAPSWYHTEIDVQIGASTPLDIESWQMPVCVLDEPIDMPITKWFGHIKRLYAFHIQRMEWPAYATRAPPQFS